MTPADVPEVHRLLTADFAAHPAPVIDLMGAQGASPFRILLATICSARTKDACTAKVVREQLFPAVKSWADVRRLSAEELARLLYPVGFYRQKAEEIKKIPDVLDARFGGRLPETVDELCELPGVGRKTANLVVAVAFKKPAVCVDVHVHRIMNRTGFVRTKPKRRCASACPRNTGRRGTPVSFPSDSASAPPARRAAARAPSAAFARRLPKDEERRLGRGPRGEAQHRRLRRVLLPAEDGHLEEVFRPGAERVREHRFLDEPNVPRRLRRPVSGNEKHARAGMRRRNVAEPHVAAAFSETPFEAPRVPFDRKVVAVVGRPQRSARKRLPVRIVGSAGRIKEGPL